MSLCVECEQVQAPKDDYKCHQCRDKEEGRSFPHLVNAFGQVIVPGDKVVWPLNVGRSAEIAYGEVVELSYNTGSTGRNYPIKAKIQPLKSKWHGRWNDTPTCVTLTKAHNIVKVDF